MTTKARAYSWCNRCDGEIQPGDDVVRRPGVSEGWIHATCASGGDDQ